ncbi:hypothetical protein E2C01_030617 [Portunus trituberculatus]|uniref:Uncharacterized protein n=1 Tax=Portunus trituberculatus TaxID=210409 RepID=A0A5B7EW86_PORTR|nr:hypothetical protein [Portunus trituberculatus]
MERWLLKDEDRSSRDLALIRQGKLSSGLWWNIRSSGDLEEGLCNTCLCHPVKQDKEVVKQLVVLWREQQEEETQGLDLSSVHSCLLGVAHVGLQHL